MRLDNRNDPYNLSVHVAQPLACACPTPCAPDPAASVVPLAPCAAAAALVDAPPHDISPPLDEQLVLELEVGIASDEVVGVLP